MFDDTATDFSDDISIPIGTDLFYAFSVQPLDATGCYASFVTDLGAFPVTLEVVTEGDQPETTFSVHVSSAYFATPSPAPMTWRILLSWPSNPPIVLPYGHGSLLITE